MAKGEQNSIAGAEGLVKGADSDGDEKEACV